MDRFKNMFINPQDEIPRDYINVKQLWDEFLPKMPMLPGLPVRITDHNMMPDDTMLVIQDSVIIPPGHTYRFLFQIDGPTDEAIKWAFEIATGRIGRKIDNIFKKYTNGNIT